jgi:hypothetical protein
MIHMRLASVPLCIMPYLGGLKGVALRSRFSLLWRIGSLTIRLPAILLSAMTLLILFQLMRAKLELSGLSSPYGS